MRIRKSRLTNEKGEQSPQKGRGAAGAPRASTAHHHPAIHLHWTHCGTAQSPNLTDSTPEPEQRRERQVRRGGAPLLLYLLLFSRSAVTGQKESPTTPICCASTNIIYLK
jgi:hypothetical protein